MKPVENSQRRRKPTPWRLALAAALGCCQPALGEEPLAACELATLAPPDAAPMAPAAMVVTSPLDNGAHYRRGPFGEWEVPETVDPADPTVHAVLHTPAGPLRLAIELRVEGEPFRATRERWIDEALTAARQPAPEPEPMPTEPAADGPDPSVVFLNAYEATDPRAWLTDYARRVGGEVDRDEARWLLAQRAGGPALVELERYSPARSSAAPLVRALDADGDGRLSSAEAAGAAERLAALDANADGDLTLAEVNADASRSADAYRVWRHEPLLEVIEAFAGEADLRLEINFAAEADGGGVRLAAAAGDHAADVVAGERAVSIGQPWGEVEVAAATRIGLPASQVSLGAVVEGSPLWSRYDADADGRLSRRERQRVADGLPTLDRDGDGAIAADEIPVRIRLAAAPGANVHAFLGEPTRPVRRAGPEAEPVAAPDWFASMDANGDGDLTPDEFLGAAEQFAGLDADGDGFVTAREAAGAD